MALTSQCPYCSSANGKNLWFAACTASRCRSFFFFAAHFAFAPCSPSSAGCTIVKSIASGGSEKKRRSGRCATLSLYWYNVGSKDTLIPCCLAQLAIVDFTALWTEAEVNGEAREQFREC